MAVTQEGIDITLPAAADLSAKQFYAMIVDTTGRATTSGALGKVIGILQNKPAAAGRAAQIRIVGISKLVGGAALAEQDYVASNAQGFGTAAASLNDEVFAQVLTQSGGSGDVTDVIIQRFRY